MPAIKLTEKAAATIKPGAARREIADALCPGLYLVLQPSGLRGWAVRTRVDGRPVKITLGGYPALKLADARQRAGECLRAVAEGRDPRQEKAQKRADETRKRQETLAALLDEFEKRHLATLRSGKEAARILRRELGPPGKDGVGAGLLDRSIHSIGRKDIVRLLDGAVDRDAATLANRLLAHLRKMFNWAVARGELEANPCQGVRPPAKETSRDRCLTDEELAKIWRACDRLGYPFGPAIRLLILTGQRREEVGRMTWSELDLDAGLWIMPRERTKGGRRHVVPLGGTAVELLRGLPRVAGSPHVFTTTGRTAISGWSRAKSMLDAALADEGVAAWVIHDIRRSAASGLVRLGMRPDVVEAVLGHAHPGGSQLASVYQRHSYLPEMTDALGRWGRHIEAITTESAATIVTTPRRKHVTVPAT